MDTKKRYFYKVYGLNIDSNIEVSEFQLRNKSNEDKDVITMLYGQASNEIKEELKLGRRNYVSKNNIWFYIDGVATYWITGGNTVIIEPCENCDKVLMKIYVLGSVLGFLLLQREVTAIHGGTVVIDGKAIVFTGERGAGKSTLTTALGQRGYSFVSDDIATVNFENKLTIEPGFPYHKLCLDALDNMNYIKEDYIFFQADGKIKYIVPDYDGFAKKKVVLSAICEIAIGDVEEVQIEEIYGSEKLDKIIKNIYRIEYIGMMGGMTPKYFKNCIQIAKNIKFYKIIRPRDKYTVNAQIEIIEDVFKNHSPYKAM
ncbi:hypothetical protein [Clostridium sp.]|uniref:hypothetical protein n=1 Tax=Clostridium sp. TaxID=1506 RepID=UPI003216E53B